MDGKFPQEKRLSEAFNAALADLRAGHSADEALKDFPDLASVLTPFVETASQALRHGAAPIPPGAQHRSRTRMLVYAEKLRGRRSSRFGWPFFRRLAFQLLAVLVVLAASLTGLAAASAQTIPGDQLYGIKRTVEDFQLNLTQSQTRGSLERVFRERRLDEIQRVIADGRLIKVDFEGVVTQAEGTSWEIAGFTVLLDNQTSLLGEILPGMLVRVQGQTTSGGEIQAESIHIVAYAFTGPLESLAGEVWVVAGVPVLITSDTQVAPGVAIGASVVVLAQVSDSGTVSARAVLLADILNSSSPPTEGGASGGDLLPEGSTSGTPPVTPSPSVTQSATPEPSGTPSEALATPDDHGTEEFEPTEEEHEDEEDNSGSGSSNSGSGSSSSGSGGGDDDKTEEPGI